MALAVEMRGQNHRAVQLVGVARHAAVELGGGHGEHLQQCNLIRGRMRSDRA